MKLVTKNPKLFDDLSIWTSTIIRLLMNALLLIIIAALCIGVVKSGLDLFMSLGEPLDKILQNLLLDVVFIVALVEIAITVLGYLKDGQVHVRYIVDTILIIMLNEIVTLFFKGSELPQIVGICIVIATLAAVRLSVTRWAPHSKDL